MEMWQQSPNKVMIISQHSIGGMACKEDIYVNLKYFELMLILNLYARKTNFY